MRRTEILRTIGWVIAVALMALFGFYLVFEIPSTFMQQQEVDPSILGARGEYLGYAVGVPVAIGGALAAVLIALSTDQVARHQMMLAASDYRDKKMDSIKENVRNFANKLQRLRRVGDQLSKRIEGHRSAAQSTTELMDLATADERVVALHDELMEALDDLSRAILELSSDDVVHFAVEAQRGSSRNKIRDAVVAYWGEYDTSALSRDILDVRDRIDFLVEDNTVEDSIAAAMLMPPGFHSLDFLGAFIRVVNRDGEAAKQLLRDQRLQPGDELLNYGLALLATLYQLLPSDDVISDTIAKLYQIQSLGRRGATEFKAREVFFSRATLDVVNEAIDGKRLFFRIRNEDIVSGTAISFLDHEEKPKPRGLSQLRPLAMLRRR